MIIKGLQDDWLRVVVVVVCVERYELLSLFEQESPIYNWFHYFTVQYRDVHRDQNQHIIHNMSFNQIKGMKIINISSSSSSFVVCTTGHICMVVFVYILPLVPVNQVLWCDMRRLVCKCVCWLKRKWNYIKLAPHFHFPFSAFLYLRMTMITIIINLCVAFSLCDYWQW